MVAGPKRDETHFINEISRILNDYLKMSAGFGVQMGNVNNLDLSDITIATTHWEYPWQILKVPMGLKKDKQRLFASRITISMNEQIQLSW